MDRQVPRQIRRRLGRTEQGDSGAARKAGVGSQGHQIAAAACGDPGLVNSLAVTQKGQCARHGGVCRDAGLSGRTDRPRPGRTRPHGRGEKHADLLHRGR